MEKSESRAWESYHTVYTNAKAGMDGVDKEKVQRVAYEMSKGSKYFENEQRKESLLQHKIHTYRQRRNTLSPADLSHFHKVAQTRILDLDSKRDLSTFWLHLDMDAFFAAVETLSNPSLKGVPMAVGSLSMISTANYEARSFGVRAAMPGFIARKLCPHLIFVPPHFHKYTHFTNLTRKVFQRYDPNFISPSLDEAYLDITPFCHQTHRNPDQVAQEIRTCVFQETGLTCSAGVAPNRLLAKVCSDINKPNGQFILPNDRVAVMTFISSLPIRKIGGIGKVTEGILRSAFEIDTCKDFLEKGGILCALFSSSSADFFLSVGLGLGNTDAPHPRLRKSMSNERTFSATKDETFLYKMLAELAETLASDLQKEGLRGRTLTLKLKTASFEVQTRAVTLTKWICSNEDILLHAKKLLKAELPASLRLIGLRVSQFSEDQLGRSDPMQKCITDFITVAGTSDHDINSSKLKAKDNPFTNEIGDYSATRDNNVPFNSDQLSDFCFLNEEATCVDNNSLLNGNQLETCDFVRHISEVHEPIAVQLLEAGISHSSKSRDKVTKCSNNKDNEVSSLSLLDQFQWVDDYKCSICGIELPLDFVEERLEHFDFHLAERLQEDGSDSNSISHFSKKRHIQREKIVSPSRKKGRKSLPKQGKYLPIDQFFFKSNQNT